MPLTAAQQDLAAEYVNLARGQARSYFFKRPARCDLDDVLSAAMFGLCQALETWEAYCERNSYDPSREDYRRAYLLKRINGSILDMARSADHLTRADRVKVKALRQAEDDGARTDDERAAATGLSAAQVRRLRADAMVTVSLDDQDALSGAEYAGPAVTDHGADVEAQAVVSEILGSFMAAFDALTAEQQVILAMRYHGRELEFAEIAEALRCSPERVAQLHDAAVCAVHRALLLAVSALALEAVPPGQTSQAADRFFPVFGPGRH